MNFRRATTLVFTVVPLEQIAIDLGRGSEAGQLAGAGSALQWAGEDLGKGEALQPLAEPSRVAFAAFGQREIGKSRVLAR